MTEDNADALITYLTELWLATPGLKQESLTDNRLQQVVVHGQVFPTNEDRVRFNYKIEKPTENTFEVSGYTVSLLETPGIKHIKNELADTKALEKRLKAINWEQSYDNMVLQHPAVEDLVAEVLTNKLLGRSLSDISDQLMVRYWQGTPMEQDVLGGIIPKGPEPKEITFNLDGQYSDIDLIEAYNLLKGRSVMKAEALDPAAGPELNLPWLVLEGGQLIKLPPYDIDNQIRKLPHTEQLDDITGPALLVPLMKGELVPLRLNIDGKITDGFLQADAKNASLIYYDADGKHIPTNDLVSQPGKEQNVKESNAVPTAKPNKRKGKHL